MEGHQIVALIIRVRFSSITPHGQVCIVAIANNDISSFERTSRMCLLQNRYFFQVKFFEISEVGVS